MRMTASKQKDPDSSARHSGSSAAYRPEYCAVAKKMLADGAGVADLAERFGVSIRTVRQWQAEHNDFLAACMLGRGRRDRNVEQALFKRAVGYDREVDKILVCDGEIVHEKYIEHVPPDVGTSIFWLINGATAEWSHTPEPLVVNTGASKDEVWGDIKQQLIDQIRNNMRQSET